MKKVRVGVVGIGQLGEAHLHHLVSLPGVEVVGIYDQDQMRLQEVASKYEMHCFGTVEEIWEQVEAVSVVVSTASHYAIAKSAIEHGQHVFIEKPMTRTLEEADDLLALQQKKGIIVQIGLIERFNPAFTALKGYPLYPMYIESHRFSPFSHRGADASVVLDLMIHDIDVILSIIPAEIEKIDATGFSVITKTMDYANARILFSNGAVANISSSRIASDRVRKMRIFQEDSRISIDFLKKETAIYRFADTPDVNGSERVMEQLQFEGRSRFLMRQALEVPFVDALQEELKAFISAVKGESAPVVTAAEGRKALAASIDIIKAAELNAKS